VGQCRGPKFRQVKIRRVKRSEGKTKGLSDRQQPEPKKQCAIALRLPEADLTKARQIAARKGIGYQTLLKMLLHEGLQREARRG